MRPTVRASPAALPRGRGGPPSKKPSINLLNRVWNRSTFIWEQHIVRKPRTKQKTSFNPRAGKYIQNPSLFPNDTLLVAVPRNVVGGGLINQDLQWLSKPLSEYRIPFLSPSPDQLASNSRDQDLEWLSKPLSDYQIPGDIPDLDSLYDFNALSSFFNDVPNLGDG